MAFQGLKDGWVRNELNPTISFGTFFCHSFAFRFILPGLEIRSRSFLPEKFFESQIALGEL
jgi:hypothetical protein